MMISQSLLDSILLESVYLDFNETWKFGRYDYHLRLIELFFDVLDHGLGKWVHRRPTNYSETPGIYIYIWYKPVPQFFQYKKDVGNNY